MGTERDGVFGRTDLMRTLTLYALLATVNMPGGVPVGTMGLGSAGARNAALFAAQILAVADPAIAEGVAALRAADADKVRAKDAKVRAEHPPE